MATERLDIRVDESGALVVKRRIEGIGKSAVEAEGGVSLLRRALGLLGGALAVREFGRFVDTAANLANRLKTVTRTSKELARVQEQLFQISQRTRVGYEGVVELFARTSRATEHLGITQQQLLQFTESLNQAVTLSGATATEANNALIQLSQGLASGQLRGEEFRSVMEQIPEVGQVIADSLGVTRGELRELAFDGQLTAEVVINAFAKAREELDERFGRTTATLGQRFTQLRNATIKFAGEVDDAIGITAKLGAVLQFLAENLNLVAGALAAVAVAMSRVIARQVLIGFTHLLAAVQKLAFAVATNPMLALAAGVTAATVAIVAMIPRVGELSEGLDPALSDALAQVSPAFARMSETADDARESMIDLVNAGDIGQFDIGRDSLSDFNDQLERLATAADKAGVSLFTYKLQVLRSLDALDRVRVSIFKVDAILNQSNDRYEEAAKAIAKGNKKLEEATEILDKHKSAIAKARREYEQLVTDVESFRSALDPVVAAQLELRDAERLLQRARAAGLITQQQEIRLLEKKREALEENLTAQQRIEAFGGVEAGGFERFGAPSGPSLLGLVGEGIARGKAERDERAAEAAEASRKVAEAFRQARREFAAFQESQPGFSSALRQIRDDLTDVGTATERTMINAFRGAEDALVKFVQTGKFEFRSLVDSILADLTRLLIRQAFLQLLGNPAGATRNAGSLGGIVGGLLGGGIPGAAHGADFTVPGTGSPDSKLLAMRVTPGERIVAVPPNTPGRAAQGAPAPSQRPVVNVGVAISPDDIRSAMSGEEGERVIVNAIARNPSLIRNVTGGG